MALNDERQKPASGGRVMRVVLLSLSFVGLGVLIGFGSFYVHFSWRCEALLHEMQAAHKYELNISKTLHEEVTDKYNTCVADNRNNREVEELKGRLEAQAALADHQNNLVNQHQAAKEEIERLLELKEIADETIESLEGDLDALENQVEDHREEMKEVRRQLQESLAQLQQESKSRLEQALQDQLQEFQREKDQSSQKLKDITNAHFELETKLGETLAELAGLHKEREERARKLADVEQVANELTNRLQEQESTSSETIAILEEELKEETLQWMKCQAQLENLKREVAKCLSREPKSQQHSEQEQSAPQAADLPCNDEHEDCHVWASHGECDSNPTYMNRYCRKSCNICTDDTGTKWIDSEAAPTLDDEIAATVNA